VRLVINLYVVFMILLALPYDTCPMTNEGENCSDEYAAEKVVLAPESSKRFFLPKATKLVVNGFKGQVTIEAPCIQQATINYSGSQSTVSFSKNGIGKSSVNGPLSIKACISAESHKVILKSSNGTADKLTIIKDRTFIQPSTGSTPNISNLKKYSWFLPLAACAAVAMWYLWKKR